mgnify:CR=1 FL=1
MANELEESKYRNELRKKAEELVIEPNYNPPLESQQIKSFIHELQVHQIELEMQNDELKELSHELKRAKKHYLDLFDNAPIGYLLLDASNTITQCNATALKLFQINKEDIIDKKIQKFIDKKDQDIFYLFTKKVNNCGEKYHCELHLLGAEGNYFWAYIQVTLEEDYKGKPLYKMTIEDISKRKKLEEELLHKEEMLIVQAKSAGMGEMIGNIAHQWRQPLTTISMGINNIRLDMELNTLDINTTKDQCLEIEKQVKYLSQTIDDFRNFFKPIKQKETFEIVDVIEQTLSIVGQALENNNIQIVQEYQSNETINAYKNELIQALLSILNNAKDSLIKSNKEIKNITISTYKEEESIIITITDNGIGIKKNIIDKIFDPYFTTKNNSNGTGLGLYITKTIIEKHLKSKIKVFSPKEGACFKIEIPIK